MEAASTATGGVPRVFAVIRALSAVQAEGGRVTQLARAVGLTQGTTHRLLQSLVAEGMVEQDERSKLYRLSMDLFALAAKAGNPGDLRLLPSRAAESGSRRGVLELDEQALRVVRGPGGVGSHGSSGCRRQGRGDDGGNQVLHASGRWRGDSRLVPADECRCSKQARM